MAVNSQHCVKNNGSNNSKLPRRRIHSLIVVATAIGMVAYMIVLFQSSFQKSDYGVMKSFKSESSLSLRQHHSKEEKLVVVRKLRQKADEMLNLHGRWEYLEINNDNNKNSSSINNNKNGAACVDKEPFRDLEKVTRKCEWVLQNSHCSSKNYGVIMCPKTCGHCGKDANNWIWIQDKTTNKRWASRLGMVAETNTLLQLSSDHETNRMKTTSFPDHLQIVFYGSSFTRSLFLDMERLHFNISTRKVCDNLSFQDHTEACHTSEEWASQEVQKQYSPLQKNGDCLPWHLKYSLGSRAKCTEKPCAHVATFQATFPEGVDIETCGPPGFRLLPELQEEMQKFDSGTHHSQRKVGIGFKTYIHTPPTDNLLLERLKKVGLEKPDVAIVEMGSPWGPRGERNTLDGSLPVMSQQEEIEYYVNFVHTVAFPDIPVVWVATCGCNGSGSGNLWKNDVVGVEETWELVKKHDLAIVLDKRFLCRERPTEMKVGHGCSGPVTSVLGRMAFALLYALQDELLRQPQ